MKKWLALLLCALMVLSCVACKKQDAEEDEADYSFADGDQYDQIGGELNVLNWGEYIDPELISLFEKETGVKVNYTEMTSNEEMLIKLRSADNPYDMCFPSDYIIEKLIKDDLLMPLDMSKIPNKKNIADRMYEVTNTFDPGNKYSLPYMWGTVGILYNTKMVEEDVDSWGILWDEKYAGKIIMPNSIREADMVAAKLLGYSMNTLDEEEMDAITQKLIEQKPLVYSYANDNARDLMIGDNASMAVITSGDVLYAQEDNENLAYVIPVEGTEVWTDCWAVPKSCKNYDGAMAWINFMYSYDAAVANFEYLTYAIPNTQLDDYVYEDYIEGETVLSEIGIINPSEEILARCETLKNLGPEGDDMYSRYWKIFKSK